MTPAILDDARRLVRLAGLAYADRAHDLSAGPDDASPAPVVVERGNVRVVVSEEDGTQTVAFAGSDDVDDWLGNLCAWKVARTDLGRLHNGFADCDARVRRDLMELLDPAKRQVFTGHSLGGALAQIAAVRAARRGLSVSCVHTFGAPMVGDADWAARYDACGLMTRCWVAGWDRVPLQPRLLGIPLGYRRVRDWRFLGLDGRLLDGAPGLFTGKPWRTWTRRRLNHSVATYADVLERAAHRADHPERTARAL